MDTTSVTGTSTWVADYSERGVPAAGIGYAAFRMAIEEVAWQAGQDFASLLGGFLADQLYLANCVLGVLAIVWAVVDRSARRGLAVSR
jgi:hypothetical protein